MEIWNEIAFKYSVANHEEMGTKGGRFERVHGRFRGTWQPKAAWTALGRKKALGFN